MKISAKCEYACRALLELSLHEPADTPLQINVIAQRKKIPEKYLVQILIQLKQAGLVRSIRGKEGGYVLARSPKKISLLEIVSTIDGPLIFAECLEPLPNEECEQKKDCVLRPVWEQLGEKIQAYLEQVTFDVLCKNYKKKDQKQMYFI